MTCFHPITVWKSRYATLDTPPEVYYKTKKVKFRYSSDCDDREKITIPCGHCLGCRLDHANMWATRIMVEAKEWTTNCVIALTYNDKNLRKDEKTKLNTLYKKDLQDFLKRLRYYEKGVEEWTHPIKGIKENPIRYFACGEYGRSGTRAPAGGNPHFHVILFNWKPKDLKFYKYNKYGDTIWKSESLQKIWGNGFVTIEELNYNTACYVARYVQKKAGIASIKREYTEKYEKIVKIDERNGKPFETYKREIKKPELLQENEFITMSRGVGIGVQYWNKNKEKVKRNKGILLKIKDKTKLKPIPRYYKKLWEAENYVEYYRFKYEVENDMIKKKAEIIAQVDLPDGTTEQVKYDFYLSQIEKILLDKTKSLKRNNFI